MFLVQFILIYIMFDSFLPSKCDWIMDMRSRYQPSCSESEMCLDQSISNANFIKSNKAKFDKCPDSKFCFHPDSRIRLRDSSGLFLEEGCALKISGNSTVQMEGDAFFKIATRSFFFNSGNISISSSTFVIFVMSETKNDGEIIQGHRSRIKLNIYSQLKLHETARIILESDSELEIKHRSYIEMKPLFESPSTKQEIILKNKSSLHVTDGSYLHLRGGQIVLNEGSRLELQKGSEFHLAANVELSKGSNMYISGDLRIGTISERRDANRIYRDSSLIYAKNDITLDVREGTRLYIYSGIHCSLHKSWYIENRTNDFDSEIRNEYLNCYSSRDKLMEGLASSNSTTEITVN